MAQCTVHEVSHEHSNLLCKQKHIILHQCNCKIFRTALERHTGSYSGKCPSPVLPFCYCGGPSPQEISNTSRRGHRSSSLASQPPWPPWETLRLQYWRRMSHRTMGHTCARPEALGPSWLHIGSSNALGALIGIVIETCAEVSTLMAMVKTRIDPALRVKDKWFRCSTEQ